MAETDRACAMSSPGKSLSNDIPRKPIKPPTITPRRFKKFFTPSSTSKIQHNVRTSRRALQEITNPPGKRTPSSQAPKLIGEEDDGTVLPPLLKEVRGSKRKLSFAPLESGLLSSPLRPDPFFFSSSQDIQEGSVCDRRGSEQPSESQEQASDEDDVAEDDQETVSIFERRNATRPFNALSRSSHILSKRLSGRTRQKEPRSSKSWLCETASFFSSAQDTYFCGSQTYTHPTLPFCVVGCNTNSLVAVGDEEGGIRLLDSASRVVDGFSKAYLSLKPHDNAIIDLDFSEDDRLLATGSGDQTCRIIDMLTQETLHTLSGHGSSVKRVHFQPASRNSIVASCSRDGNVNIWDLRTRSVDRPAQQLCRASSVCSDGCFEDQRRRGNMPVASRRDTIRAAHADRDRSRKAAASKLKPHHRRDEASVTSLLFLGAGREHLLATSSEADATIKLWDMRTTYDTRRARPLPVSTTRQPHSHETHRSFGITSMALGYDSARMFTLCRDNTVYAYSTSHLILGSAPELTDHSHRPRRAGGAERGGLGPMYGFRHQQLQVSTFYVKLSIRKQKDDQTELLAVGSGSDCAVLFPTNERYLERKSSSEPRLDQARPSLRRSESGLENAPSVNDDLPIYQHGTALVRGHHKEVTAVTWTNGGQLVTTSDDFHVRCWREGDESRELRTNGEGQGKRWMCGWAEADGSYDEDDDA